MRIEPRKALTAASVSAALLAALFWTVDFRSIDLAQLRPSYVIVTVASYVCCVSLRAARLRALAPAPLRKRWFDWLRLAARHQAVFMLAPSGIGDVSFPILATRYTPVAASDAVRMIAQFRLRDVVVLILVAAIGTVFMGPSFDYVLIAVPVGLFVLYRVDDIAVLFLHLAARLLPNSRLSVFLQNCVSADKTAAIDRGLRTALAIATWSSAAIALFFAFAAVGRELTVGETLLMLAVLNAVGAAAVSVAGFGIAETGVTGVLVAMGEAPSTAAATALMARPLLLVSMIAACGLLDLTVLLRQA
jgi:uncharacterized membrane protein YbhN (UPF0104 family)